MKFKDFQDIAKRYATYELPEIDASNFVLIKKVGTLNEEQILFHRAHLVLASIKRDEKRLQYELKKFDNNIYLFQATFDAIRAITLAMLIANFIPLNESTKSYFIDSKFDVYVYEIKAKADEN